MNHVFFVIIITLIFSPLSLAVSHRPPSGRALDKQDLRTLQRREQFHLNFRFRPINLAGTPPANPKIALFLGTLCLMSSLVDASQQVSSHCDNNQCASKRDSVNLAPLPMHAPSPSSTMAAMVTALRDSAHQPCVDNNLIDESFQYASAPADIMMPSLETTLAHHWNVTVDISRDVEFEDYLVPNENHPHDGNAIFTQLQPGIIIAVGTERVFFDALMAPAGSMIIGRDINDRVKAYGDFNVLLLRLAKDLKDYVSLRMLHEAKSILLYAIRTDTGTGNEPIEVKQKLLYEPVLEELRRRLNKSAMPVSLKNYYNKNLEDFASIFYRTQVDPLMLPFLDDVFRNDFEKSKYFYNKTQFAKLHALANNGSIVFTIGSIDDLGFLDKLDEQDQIVALDISNIPDYFIPRFEHPRINKALLIFTKFSPKEDRYKYKKRHLKNKQTHKNGVE